MSEDENSRSETLVNEAQMHRCFSRGIICLCFLFFVTVYSFIAFNLLFEFFFIILTTTCD